MSLPPRILVVEDEAALAEATARILRHEGYEVVVVGSADDARDAIGTFDCGVFDIDLSGSTGIEVATDLLDSGTVWRAVFYTALVDGDALAEAEALGPVVHKLELP